MSEERIAALPMYDFPELTVAHDGLWQALAMRLSALGVTGVPPTLTRDRHYIETWQDPQLLLGQACEYPLTKSYADGVRLVATPRYSARGCQGARYCSAIVVSADDARESLADFRHSRCVVNQTSSNSGMNLLRASIACLADGEPFFGSVAESGSHLASAAAVAAGRADLAAVDCVTYAHLTRNQSELVARLRILAWTPSSPSLPLITAPSTDDGTLAALRSALSEVAADAALAPVRERLLLVGFDVEPDSTFSTVLGYEREAEKLGYPTLC